MVSDTGRRKTGLHHGPWNTDIMKKETQDERNRGMRLVKKWGKKRCSIMVIPNKTIRLHRFTMIQAPRSKSDDYVVK